MVEVLYTVREVAKMIRTNPFNVKDLNVNDIVGEVDDRAC